MNNRGQVLVMFVILIPILFIVFGLVVDIGYGYIEKRNVLNNTYDAVEYMLEHIEESNIEDKTKELLNKNIKDIDSININTTDDYVEIKVSKTNKKVLLKTNLIIEVTYKGMIESKRIVKE